MMNQRPAQTSPELKEGSSQKALKDPTEANDCSGQLRLLWNRETGVLLGALPSSP